MEQTEQPTEKVLKLWDKLGTVERTQVLRGMMGEYFICAHMEKGIDGQMYFRNYNGVVPYGSYAALIQVIQDSFQNAFNPKV